MNALFPDLVDETPSPKPPKPPKTEAPFSDVSAELKVLVSGLSPLAYQLAPKTFDEYVGQSHLVGPDKPLRRWIANDQFGSMIFWGPPGVGKTALSRLISTQTKAEFIALNAVMAKVQDLRAAIATAEENLTQGKRTLLFIDEIHRFNKSQQDALLPDLEKGTVILMGATTENPFFSVNPSILSRSQVFELQPLTDDDLLQVMTRALTHPLLSSLKTIDAKVSLAIRRQAQGDARRLLNLLERLAVIAKETPLTESVLMDVTQNQGTLYREEEHYNIISAYIKSMRASDAEGAMHWLARMIKGGEDPRFIARRLLIFASEDVGNADPHALPLAVSALQTVQFIGWPESKYTLSQVTLYMANAPKSRAAVEAVSQALESISKGTIPAVPSHLKNHP